MLGSAIIIAPFSDEEEVVQDTSITVQEVEDKANINEEVKAEDKKETEDKESR